MSPDLLQEATEMIKRTGSLHKMPGWPPKHYEKYQRKILKPEWSGYRN